MKGKKKIFLNYSLLFSYKSLFSHSKIFENIFKREENYNISIICQGDQNMFYEKFNLYIKKICLYIFFFYQFLYSRCELLSLRRKV